MSDLLAPAARPGRALPVVHVGWTVADAVAVHPLVRTVVAAFGLDPERHGARTLAAAAAAGDVDLEALVYCIGSVLAAEPEGGRGAR